MAAKIHGKQKWWKCVYTGCLKDLGAYIWVTKSLLWKHINLDDFLDICTYKQSCSMPPLYKQQFEGSKHDRGVKFRNKGRFKKAQNIEIWQIHTAKFKWWPEDSWGLHIHSRCFRWFRTWNVAHGSRNDCNWTSVSEWYYDSLVSLNYKLEWTKTRIRIFLTK